MLFISRYFLCERKKCVMLFISHYFLCDRKKCVMLFHTIFSVNGSSVSCCLFHAIFSRLILPPAPGRRCQLEDSEDPAAAGQIPQTCQRIYDAGTARVRQLFLI